MEVDSKVIYKGKKMKSLDSILTDYNTMFGEFNREAIMAVKYLLEDFKINFSPLLIYGNVGIGKTHILKVAKAYMKINGNDDSTIIYFDFRGLSRYLFDSQSMHIDQKMKYFDRASIIILDDLHHYTHRDRTQDYVLDIISKSRELKIPIIVAGNNHPYTMVNGFNPSLLSRVCGGVSVKIDVPDIKSRVNFVHMLTKTKGIIIDPKIEGKVIEYFGSYFSIIQGVINRFELFSTLNNGAVMDNLAFDLIFKDEINHFKTLKSSLGEPV
ncbi:MAG: chromosomal replication initiator protein [Psychroserpens sp.]|jgi:chromosomal replication initiator protein